MNSKQAIDKIMKVLGLAPQSFYEAKTEQGIAVKIDGDLEVGAPIYVATDEGMIPAPAGTHKLDDGSEIEVDEDGKVAKIKMGDMEMEKTEDEKIEDNKKKEDIKDETMSEKFADVKLKDGKMIRISTDEPAVGTMAKMVGYDGTLSALADGSYETENGKVISIVGGEIQGVQSKSDADKAAGKFVEAKSYDGAILESPTFDVGEAIDVVKDGEKSPAPDGEHQIILKDSEGEEVKIRVMVKDGKITERSNVEETDDEEMMSAVEIAEIFSQALKKLENKIDAISTKQSELDSKFQKFSKEPAGQKVYNQKTITETFSTGDRLDQFKRLREAMSHKK
jgi:hypothetical protein